MTFQRYHFRRQWSFNSWLKHALWFEHDRALIKHGAVFFMVWLHFTTFFLTGPIFLFQKRLFFPNELTSPRSTAVGITWNFSRIFFQSFVDGCFQFQRSFISQPCNENHSSHDPLGKEGAKSQKDWTKLIHYKVWLEDSGSSTNGWSSLVTLLPEWFLLLIFFPIFWIFEWRKPSKYFFSVTPTWRIIPVSKYIISNPNL